MLGAMVWLSAGPSLLRFGAAAETSARDAAKEGSLQG